MFSLMAGSTIRQYTQTLPLYRAYRVLRYICTASTYETVSDKLIY